MDTVKQACSKELFGVDWTAFFNANSLVPGTDLITSSQWVLSGGVRGLEFVNDAVTSIYIEDGTTGETIAAENIIEINNGDYRDCRTIYIRVT